MKKILLTVFSVLVYAVSYAQLLTWTPNFPTDNSSITITVDATKGNKGLQGFAGPVYLHTGVITSASTSPSDWKYVQGQWGTTNAPQATGSTNTWSFTIPNIRAFYNVPAGEQILRISILFRNQAGTLVQRNIDGSDMYIPVYSAGQFAVRFTSPAMQPMYNMIPEPIGTGVTSLPVTAVTSQNAAITLRFNNNQIGSATNATTASGTANVTTNCEQAITVEANNGATTLRDTINFFIPPAVYPTGARPAGRKDGITFENNNTEAVFILYAPGKQRVSVIGDFNNWTQTCSGLMSRDVDGNGNFYYWARITGLTPGQQYRFQYLVDDSIRVADPYSELVLDPNNDRFIASATFPNMPAYPTGKTSGIVGVITPGEAPFGWTDGAYQRPNKYNLVIYQLLVRDFVFNQNWQSLKDTLPYLAALGFNAIKVLPFNEFDGNNSWGYNPMYYFAPDKAYGTKNALKEFINAAHNNGMAVIMDIAFNHATGQSPLAALWWNSSLSRPAANSPYFYETAQHDFNVFNDFNHNVAPTRYHTERFIEHWLTEYKLDGFRWDLSKGFTTNNTIGNIGAWNSYNQGRVDIWQNYYNKMQSVSNSSYCILEHLGNPDEEAELAKRGMLLWGKMTDQFTANVTGNAGGSDVNTAYWKNRSFWNDAFLDDKPGLIAYAESHDEERVMFNALNAGGSVVAGNLNGALARTEAMAAVLMAIPGPKMIWQFGELGYDFSINSNGGRTNPKPIRWDYFQNTNRRRLYEVFAAMAKLRKQKPDAFNRTTISTGTSLGSNLWKTVVINHASLKMVVVANFNNSTQIQSVTFPATGTWYDYTNGGTYVVSNTTQSVTLPAGGYRVYIDQNIPGGLVTNVRDIIANSNEFKLKVSPNPVQQQATITYELPKSGQVSIQLINMQGQVMATKNMGFQLKGYQVQQLNRDLFGGISVTPGQYLLQVRVDNVVRYEKIVMQQF
ncbi:alpha-amylase family glycosyl hydrolase [Lacibacter sp. MH-610]|uniref:alpha-amylase family glycosyl hydrolase n=1 Tax=Lacibacter sp. MH-610 TaxID=3020883 RepID=UPI003891DA01